MQNFVPGMSGWPQVEQNIVWLTIVRLTFTLYPGDMFFFNTLGVNDMQRRLGHRIRELREKQGFKTQDQFSQFMGLHRTVIGFWETSRKDLRLSTLIRIADALGVTLSELFAGLESGDGPVISNPRSLNRDRVVRDFTVLEE